MTATALDLRALDLDELVTGFSQAAGESYKPWFNELNERIASKLRTWLLEQGAHRNDVDDLSQIFWLELIQYRDSFQPGQKAQPWIKQQVANVVRRIHRDESRKKRRPNETMLRIGDEAASDGAIGTDAEDREMKTPLDQLLEQETKLDLHERIAKLSPKLRQSIELHYFEGLTHEQIAERLEIPLGTSFTRLQRAIQKLRGDGEAQPQKVHKCTAQALELSEATEYVAL